MQWKSAEIRRNCSSVKSAGLFAIDFGASQMCYLAKMGKHLSRKPVRLTLMTDSQTTIDSLRSVWPIIDRMNNTWAMSKRVLIRSALG